MELFSIDDFHLDKMTKINYGELVRFSSIQLDEKLSFEANSSGMGIGAAYWTLRLGEQIKLGITTQINNQTSACQPPIGLEGLDYLILGLQDQSHTANLAQFMESTNLALSQGRNLVIPFMNHELIFDLQTIIEDNMAYQCHKIFIISNKFKSVLQFANSNVEYLNESLQNQIFQGLPKNPFHRMMNLIKTEKIIIVDKVDKLKFEKSLYRSVADTLKSTTPSVFFVYDSSFRLGQGCKLLEILEAIYTPKDINIYTKQFNAKFSMTLCLIEKDFQDPRTFVQNNLIDQFRMEVIRTPLNLGTSIDKIVESYPKIKKIYVCSENLFNPSKNIEGYEMCQRKVVNFNQIILQLKDLVEEGQSSHLIGQIKVSSAELQIDKNYNGLLIKEPIQLSYRFGTLNLESVREQIVSQVLQELDHLKVGRIELRELNLEINFINKYKNHMELIVLINEKASEVISSNIEDGNRVQRILSSTLKIQTLKIQQ